MKIEITLQQAHLKAENLQEMHMSDVIHGFFNVLTGGQKRLEQQQPQMVKPHYATPFVPPTQPMDVIVPLIKAKSLAGEVSSGKATESALRFYKENGFGLLTPHIAEGIGKWVAQVGEDLVIKAMKLAVEKDIIRWAYVESALKSWTQEQAKPSEQPNLTPAEHIVKERRVKQQVGIQPLPKALPKIDADRTLQVSIAESLEAKEEQEHWKTGIKVEDDGTKRYRCYYWCDCCSKGKRYIHEHDEIITCRECGQELYVETATPNYQTNGLPERDKFGNFFIAREVATLNND
ncbi:DnaD domain-containing protein [Bacillus ndiopicus]|uniref:DnaD domain-containing protein n=1 Tax=Bacillus ndiopicus TaxID=1347368 RepID=UPI0005A6EF8D|nr:DnaD domain protein [Bacillus ndiopicus]